MKTVTGFRKTVASGFLCLIASVSNPLSADQAILVLDGSGSMWGQVSGVAKIDIARDVIGDLMLDWNEAVELGITVYGHRRKGDCSDIEALRPVGAVEAAQVAAAVRTINPKGKTPLTAAVRKAADSLRYEEDRATVILLSDGEETCGGDPCAMAKELEAAGVDFTIHVVGFDLSDEQTTNLQCMADNTGGKFLKADDAQQLNDAMQQVKQVVAEKAVSAPEPVKKKKRVIKKQTDSTGTILIPNISTARVNLCSPDVNPDSPGDCYNSADQYWIAELSKDEPSIKVKPGQYRFKIGSHFSQPITVTAGETTEFPLGILNVENLTREDVAVCGLEAPLLDDCGNSAYLGWVGDLSPLDPAFEVLPGSYRLKMGSHFSEPVSVAANETTMYAMAKIDIVDPATSSISICGLLDADFDGCKNSAYEGWVDDIEVGEAVVEVLAGEYRLRFGNHFSAPLQVGGGESVTFALGAVEIPTLESTKVAVCALENPLPEDCGNSAYEGWVGNIDPANPAMALPAGSYQLKVGRHFSDVIEVEAGVIAEFPMGAISITDVGDEKVTVCAQESDCSSSITAGWVGELSGEDRLLELPPGTYKIATGNSRVIVLDGIEVGDGEEVEVEL